MDWWIAQLDNELRLDQNELKATSFTRTGDTSFTLHYADRAGPVYLTKSGTAVSLGGTSSSWELSGTKMQIAGSATEQVTLASNNSRLALTSSGDDVTIV